MTIQPIEERRPDAIPRHARIDVIGGALIVLLAGLIWFGAIQLNTGSLVSIGPGALPKGLAVVLLCFGAMILIQGLTQSDSRAERFFVAIRPTMIVVAAIAVFGLFIRGGNYGPVSMPQLGLMIVGPLTVFIAGCATPDLHVKSLLVLAFGLTAAMLVVFVDVLGVTIPVFPKFIQNPLTIAFGIDTVVRSAYVAYGALSAALYAVFFSLAGKPRV